jgi:hypothetical protein
MTMAPYRIITAKQLKLGWLEHDGVRRREFVVVRPLETGDYVVENPDLTLAREAEDDDALDRWIVTESYQQKYPHRDQGGQTAQAGDRDRAAGGGESETTSMSENSTPGKPVVALADAIVTAAAPDLLPALKALESLFRQHHQAGYRFSDLEAEEIARYAALIDQHAQEMVNN